MENEINSKKIDKLQNDIQNIENKLIETQKELDIYEYLYEMFGKNGLPLLEINNNLVELEFLVNNILKKLNSGMSISISTEQDLFNYKNSCSCGYVFKKQSEKICQKCNQEREKKVRNDFEIKIFYKDREVLFEMDSGGGKSLISIAIRLALTEILSKRKKMNCNFLVLDEIFGMLDEVNRESVLQLMLDILKDKFEQIFLITHTTFYNIDCKDIYIIKKDKYSTIEG